MFTVEQHNQLCSAVYDLLDESPRFPHMHNFDIYSSEDAVRIVYTLDYVEYRRTITFFETDSGYGCYLLTSTGDCFDLATELTLEQVLSLDIEGLDTHVVEGLYEESKY